MTKNCCRIWATMKFPKLFKSYWLQTRFTKATSKFRIILFQLQQHFSIVLLGLVDDGDYKFTYVDVGCNWKISDGGVFRNSSLSRDNLLNIPGERSLCEGITVPYVIVAGDTFLLKIYIMKPYAFREISEEKLNYNYHHRMFLEI